MRFYSRLRDLREDVDLTQKRVADLIGVSVNHYGKYERGETDIPLEKAIILAKFYQVSLDYLAGISRVRNPENTNDRTDTDLLKIFSAYASLSLCNQKCVDSYVMQVANAEKK